MPINGSERLVVWIKHALETQALLADLTGGDDLPALDSALRGWATDVRVRPSDLEDALRSRTTALQLVTNLRRSVAASVIEEIVRVAERSPNGTAYSVLEQHAQQFQNDTESLSEDLSNLTGLAERPFPGETRADALTWLVNAQRAAQEARKSLHQRIVAVGALIERFGGTARTIPSPLTIKEAERLASAEGQVLETLIRESWNQVQSHVSGLGLPVDVVTRRLGATLDEDCRDLESMLEWRQLVDQDVGELSSIGAPIPNLQGLDRETILEQLRNEVQQRREPLNSLNGASRLLGVAH